jgi:hypothetical protein
MAAATSSRNTPEYSDAPIPTYVVIGVKAAAIIYAGVMVALDSSGYAVMAGNAGTAAQKIIGVAEGPGDIGSNSDVDNTSGANGALTVKVRQGAFWFTNNGTSIAATNIGQACYAATDSSVDLSDGAGLRPFAGIILGVDATLGVLVQFGAAVTFSAPSASALSTAYTARAVATSALAAYASVAGVITASANGALGSVFDGVTIVAGDLILLPEGIAAATKDAGPYVVTSLGGASAKFILTRPDWWATASLIPQYKEIQIGPEGTLYKGTEWKSFVTTAIKVVDTDAPLLFPRLVLQSVVLVAGTATLTNVPIRSATLTSVEPTRIVANTSTATTGGYGPTVGGANGITAGALGTGQVILEACVAAGTKNAADVSTLNVAIQNY